MMTDKTAHELLQSLDEWARAKIQRGEGWAPGQYRGLVNFLGPAPVLAGAEIIPKLVAERQERYDNERGKSGPGSGTRSP